MAARLSCYSSVGAGHLPAAHLKRWALYMVYLGLRRFSGLMADWAIYFVEPVASKQRKTEDYSDQELKLFSEIFYRFSEIQATLANLDLCLDFVRGPMPRRKGLKLDRFLMYHITFYLQEIYILKERLELYSKVVFRTKKRINKSDAVEQRYEEQISFFQKAFQNIIDIRGSHVHARPFKDKEMENLSIYSLLSMVEPEFYKNARQEYGATRKRWVALMESNKIGIAKQMDAFFDFMYKEITEGNTPIIVENSFKRNLPL